MAVGAMKALKEKFSKDTLTKNKKYVFGFDGTAAAKSAVDKGDMVATVVQEPSKMGEYGVDWAIKLLGESNKNTDVLSDSELADKKIQLTGKVYKKA